MSYVLLFQQLWIWERFIRVYNDEICNTIDSYTNGAFFEPSYVIARAYKEGEF